MSNDTALKESGFKDRTVLVTGACGTVGAELVRQLAAAGAGRIVCLDNNETELFFLQQTWSGNAAVECYLADIRDLDALRMRCQGVDIVLHAAALKHVGLCEESPAQAVRTNIDGTQNVIDAALANGVGRVIFTSSDKAVNPTNVMGTSKLMGERLMTAASLSNVNANTVFASTRFGNVLGSRGSVVPLFRRQIEGGGPITLTDPDMTRFIMTLEEAVALVLRSAHLATGGEVFVTKMPVAKIEHIAEHMRARLANTKIAIKVIGAKPGEKMYEELMNDEEVRRSYEIDDFFVVLPAFVKPDAGRYPLIAGRPQPDRPYNSSVEPAMDLAETAAWMDARAIL
ncbi:MAG: SDR family NAD(P)-dependent oxidoreductase [Pseudomonadota bacterium]